MAFSILVQSDKFRFIVLFEPVPTAENAALDKRRPVGYNVSQQKALMGTRRGIPLAQRAGGWCEPARGPAWILAPEPPA